MTAPHVLRLAAEIHRGITRSLAERDADYLAEVRAWFPACRHGVSAWTDYDCACWQCEEGEPTGVDIMRQALVEAHGFWDDFSEIGQALPVLRKVLTADRMSELTTEIVDAANVRRKRLVNRTA